jgi:6-phosphogluconate dehydrogenase
MFAVVGRLSSGRRIDVIGGCTAFGLRIDGRSARNADRNNPGRGDIPRTPGRDKVPGTAGEGYLHCGPSGAGHFVKMVHNGIEYGLMTAYSEGLNILRHANAGKHSRTADAETKPLRNPEFYQYEFNLGDVAEVWRRGSVVASWLQDLTAIALLGQPDLSKFSGRVSDSREGRWTMRGEEEFGDRLPSAMRFEFGGRIEEKQ